jgi:acyl-CoA thioester hydrolase
MKKISGKISVDVTYRGSVYPAQCDHMGHMNVQWYVAKFDEATWNFLASIGITSSYMRENNRGMAALEQHIKYMRELNAGDIITVRSQLTELSGKIIKFRHEMFNGETGELASTTDQVACHLDTTLRKSIAFEDHIISKGENMLKEQGSGD